MVDMNANQLATVLDCDFKHAQTWEEALNKAMSQFSITTPLRQCAFLANVSHESGRLVYVKELWGPTVDQKGYERDFKAAWPPTGSDKINRKAYGLGNSNAGDGLRFRGRGPIQVTGRANYARARDNLAKVLGLVNVPNFEIVPEKMELPSWGAMCAAEFWSRNKLNDYADTDDFQAVCGIINTGSAHTPTSRIRGWDERLKLYTAAKKVFGL